MLPGEGISHIGIGQKVYSRVKIPFVSINIHWLALFFAFHEPGGKPYFIIESYDLQLLI